MKPLTEREVIVLAKQCAMRVCSTEEHHGCPYGDEGMVDCVERLEKDYEEAIDRLLLIAEGIHRGTIQEVGADGSVKATGETSDGYHTFNELYRHRTELFAALCNLFPGRAWKSTKHFDGTMEKGWFIAGIDTPDGQATYHCRGDFWNLFRVRELETAPKWDGHTPEDVLRRIQELVHTEAAYVEKLERRWETTEGYVPHCCANCGHKKSDGSCELLPDGDQFSIDYTDGFDRDDCEHWDMFIPKR